MSLKSGSHWIVVFTKDVETDMFIRKWILWHCHFHYKDTNIETCLKNRMQSTNTFTCGWWSLYYLISSKFKSSILPYLHLLNRPSINKHFLYIYFKSIFEGKWPKYTLNNQHQDASA